MTKKPLYQNWIGIQHAGKKQLGVLIDPDKFEFNKSSILIKGLENNPVDLIFVGGSLMSSNKFHETIGFLKENTSQPIVLFPGGPLQISNEADAILLLSMISGRNADLLIGKHVESAFALKETALEIIATGYMLIESGKSTSASYISATFPIPADKPEIASATALAGEMLGLSSIYLDGGSGALNPVPYDMIRQVRQCINSIMIVGGGIKKADSLKSAYQAGADIVVIGNKLEDNPEMISEFCRIKTNFMMETTA